MRKDIKQILDTILFQMLIKDLLLLPMVVDIHLPTDNKAEVLIIQEEVIHTLVKDIDLFKNLGSFVN